MKVERRSHPRGEKGTKISLEEASKRASEGRLDPRTRAWSIEKLLEAGYPASKKDQAAALLAALRRERAYVPDPTDAEFMPSAACQLAGCEGLTFLGEDCDGLLIAFLAAAGSIGIEGAVVGHSYEADGQLSHVLAAVYDGRTWHTCDPSTDEPFGQVARPTREKWLSVPGGMVMCDGRTCNRNQAPDLVRRGDGDFVGVGTPKERRGYVAEPAPQKKDEGPAIPLAVGAISAATGYALTKKAGTAMVAGGLGIIVSLIVVRLGGKSA